jgi:hypothetical protein
VKIVAPEVSLASQKAAESSLLEPSTLMKLLIATRFVASTGSTRFVASTGSTRFVASTGSTRFVALAA